MLLVDDDPDIRFIAEMSLGRIGGWEVTSAISGADALARLEAGLRPDVVLLDVSMPELDGYAVMERLRALPGCEALPVIFLTGKTREHEQERCLSLGARGLIDKPFDPMTLPALVREILGDA
ncbi:MAG: response regulator [Deltaproteobacteria bacterium]|nr:MAG: response regulator [Deltaproteobacteria bacterium]